MGTIFFSFSGINRDIILPLLPSIYRSLFSKTNLDIVRETLKIIASNWLKDGDEPLVESRNSHAYHIGRLENINRPLKTACPGTHSR